MPIALKVTRGASRPQKRGKPVTPLANRAPTLPPQPRQRQHRHAAQQEELSFKFMRRNRALKQPCTKQQPLQHSAHALPQTERSPRPRRASASEALSDPPSSKEAQRSHPTLQTQPAAAASSHKTSYASAPTGHRPTEQHQHPRHTQARKCVRTPPQNVSVEPPTNNSCGNDPSAGSPTETLLRLHLPLDGKI